MLFLSTTKKFHGIVHWRGSTSGSPPLTIAPLHGVCRANIYDFFFVGIRLTTCIMMLHRCVFGPDPFQRTTARFALIMWCSFRLGCPSEYRTWIYATTLIVNCWATVRMCAPWGVIWWPMYIESSLRDPQHGGLNESLAGRAIFSSSVLWGQGCTRTSQTCEVWLSWDYHCSRQICFAQSLDVSDHIPPLGCVSHLVAGLRKTLYHSIKKGEIEYTVWRNWNVRNILY